MVNTLVPYSYIESSTALNWSEGAWAIRNGFIAAQDIPNIAKKRLQVESEDWRDIELLDARKSLAVLVASIEEIAATESKIDEDYEWRRWVYIFLKWRYETVNFSEFYKDLFDIYYENLKPKFLEKIVNLDCPVSMSAEEVRSYTKRAVESFFADNEGVFNFPANAR